MTNNTCISCGSVIPEGRQVCYRCMKGKIIGRVLAVAVSLTAMAAMPAHAEQHDMGTLCMDVDYNGVIDGRDASAVLTEYAHTSVGKSAKFTDTQRFVADTNLDGIVDGRDATAILTTYAYNSTRKAQQPLKTVTFKLMSNRGASVDLSIEGKYFIEDWYHSVRVDSQDDPADAYYIEATVYTWRDGNGFKDSCLLDIIETDSGYKTEVNSYWLQQRK